MTATIVYALEWTLQQALLHVQFVAILLALRLYAMGDTQGQGASADRSKGEPERNYCPTHKNLNQNRNLRGEWWTRLGSNNDEETDA
jgi:hypothetical protein